MITFKNDIKENKICLKCIRWEGRIVDPPMWKARCSQIDQIVEQTAFCIFWVEMFPQPNNAPSGGFQRQAF